MNRKLKNALDIIKFYLILYFPKEFFKKVTHISIFIQHNLKGLKY